MVQSGPWFTSPWRSFGVLGSHLALPGFSLQSWRSFGPSSTDVSCLILSCWGCLLGFCAVEVADLGLVPRRLLALVWFHEYRWLGFGPVKVVGSGLLPWGSLARAWSCRGLCLGSAPSAFTPSDLIQREVIFWGLVWWKSQSQACSGEGHWLRPDLEEVAGSSLCSLNPLMEDLRLPVQGWGYHCKGVLSMHKTLDLLCSTKNARTNKIHFVSIISEVHMCNNLYNTDYLIRIQ